MIKYVLRLRNMSNDDDFEVGNSFWYFKMTNLELYKI